MRKNLDKFYGFFNDRGSERLDGLNGSHFSGLSLDEKEEAWNFLISRFHTSVERIQGMVILDRQRAVSLFEEALNKPLEAAKYSAERKELEIARLLMIKYVNNSEPDKKYLSEMTKFAFSEFEEVRAEFAFSLPVKKITPESVEALRAMIFTETNRIPQAAAVEKLMWIHGFEPDRDDSIYTTIYRALRLGSREEKIRSMNHLENIQSPDYI